MLHTWAIVNLGINESIASLCFLCREHFEQTWSLGIIGITLQSVDFQQKHVHVTNWGHNHEGFKPINPHIQHKFEVRILN